MFKFLCRFGYHRWIEWPFKGEWKCWDCDRRKSDGRG